MTDGPALLFPDGHLKYDDKGRRVGAKLCVVQWRGGKPVPVYPPSIATDDVLWPKVLIVGWRRSRPLRERLRLPLIAAPMFRVSGVDLVVAACRSGVIGAFPTANCRSVGGTRWLAAAIRSGPVAAPWCANLIVHRSNPRMQDDLAVLLRHAPEIVITSVGSPAGVVAPLHDVGALVFSDVASHPPCRTRDRGWGGRVDPADRRRGRPDRMA